VFPEETEVILYHLVAASDCVKNQQFPFDRLKYRIIAKAVVPVPFCRELCIVNVTLAQKSNFAMVHGTLQAV
jgi:hypothetical protein